ncbi:glycosyltransferase family 9 protein [Pandoraea pulmonicola]|uniref:ADP-heptose--LPS heptosyltransferase n=1 Tax=Pandoraea pulmonicola TaxID=93221 RepID=A0AAJ4ZHL2_PANPU|nr:glycosyltransferase family 9 protein [Pandoraea pulmonicola]AJC23529.2 ADP-heptose--LPS heptosyltransferase [Pandoraea pulmonicola]SUD95646.1 ADP-heptose--LPS heptosyltransferase 2 [Pandoraea pulmonicola]
MACAGTPPRLTLPNLGKHRRIVVFRALQLGDMLCAVPALRAIRLGEPAARITLAGLPWAESFASRFKSYIDDFLPFPGAPGLPEQGADAGQLRAFEQQCRERHFDLAVQLHGSGTYSNAVVSRMGAACNVGFVPHDEASPVSADLAEKGVEHGLPWPEAGSEVHRCLELTRAMGYQDWGDHLEFPLAALDYATFQVLCDKFRLEPGRFVVIHPGSRMPSRRWPVERYASVADKVAKAGFRVVLTGGAHERDIAQALAARAQEPVIDFCSKTSLGTLAALIAHARLLICNDTGVSHIAAAMGARSVVVACGSDVARWAPLDAERHDVLAKHPACRPCMFHSCPYGHECATEVSVAQVMRHVRAMLSAGDSVCDG